MNILVKGQKCELKLEPRVVKSIRKGKVNLEDIIEALVVNDDLLASINDSTFYIEEKGAIVAGNKCGNKIELEFADNPKNIKKVKVD